MRETFFIGDTHFGHRNIVVFESTKPFRPGDSIEEHNEELVRRWNSVVGPKDRVIHCGDFAFGAANIEYAGRLNGIKTLVAGNHDTYPTEKYLAHFDKVVGALAFDAAICTHIPVHPRELNRFLFNIHGHLHTETIDDYRYINVSCEQIDCTPVNYEILKKRYSESLKNV